MELFETNLDEVRTQKFAKGKLKVALKSLRQNDAAPMLYLKEKRKDHTGEVTETYATDPIEIGRVARDTWLNVYAGNVKDKLQHV